MKTRADTSVRFWRHVDKDAPNGCWAWKAKSLQFNIGGRTGPRISVLRFVWELLRDALPIASRVAHTCRANGFLCVNPDHLEVRTSGEMEQARMSRHIQKGGDDDCWFWKGRSLRGSIRVSNGKTSTVARAAWELENGSIPKGFRLVHTCAGGSSCVNVRHLKLRDESGGKEALFWRKVVVVGLDDCWNWTGAITTHGYGSFNGLGGYAHRVAWQFKFGAIADNLHVLHKCDNRLCVNPNHLFLGTNRDNVYDKLRKGREARGVQMRLAKLNDEKALAMRHFRAAGATFQHLGKLFHVTERTASGVCSGKSWKHVPMPKPEVYT